MIARLTGTVAEKQPDQLIVDVNGVGYQVLIPLTTFYKVGEVGASITLSIHTNVREDAIQLFGFLDSLEKAMFHMLVKVSGIGPKLALKLLSGMEAPALANAIAAGNQAELIRIPGLGKKTAERIVLELRDKAAKLASETSKEAGVPLVAFSSQDEDVISALTNLGYKAILAEQVLSKIKKAKPEITDVEALLREALKSLSKTK
jgi:Holliday junction DNA helicase RuvA